MIRRTLAAAALAASLLPALPASAAELVQPGGYVESGGAICTLNFVYDGTGSRAGKVYVGTAAHCVGRVGDDAHLITGETFGDVAYIGDEDQTARDFALIEVRAGFVSRVSPAVKGHPTLPRSGYTTPGETATGDLIQLSGYGTGFEFLALTREKRQAVLSSDTTEVWRVAGPLSWGDSGGPLVHVKTGKALGIESRVCIGICTDEGPTVQGIVSRAAAAGFPVTLRTVS